MANVELKLNYRASFMERKKIQQLFFFEFSLRSSVYNRKAREKHDNERTTENFFAFASIPDCQVYVREIDSVIRRRFTGNSYDVSFERVLLGIKKTNLKF